MRPSYLARHSGGRYYLQMRARGVVAGELSIRLIRANLLNQRIGRLVMLADGQRYDGGAQ